MDYKVYQITKKEMFRYAAVYILADVLISLLFYRSVLAAVVFLPGICFFFREVRRELAKKRRKQLERGFLVGMKNFRNCTVKKNRFYRNFAGFVWEFC